MKIISGAVEMQQLATQLHRQGKRIGFVPTMGCLHAGHLSLVDTARSSSDVVVVSIFVNPTQFGKGEDFDKYPRDAARDLDLCRSKDVDIVFIPPGDQMYAVDHGVYVEESNLSTQLCGAFRPGHFRGVLTVVCKLFNIVRPDVAVFGQKDAQQVRLIELMTRDLDFGIRIVVAPTVREPDGLAMSSRNMYLSPEERKSALCLGRALAVAREAWGKGERDISSIKRRMIALLESTALVRIQYVEIVDHRTLRPFVEPPASILVAVAVRIGSTRLIDNCLMDGATAATPSSATS
ncbi:MAG: pantoate--beta-alanine ligase [Verrucomicrobia bacterium]|nr:pantoate--beta-alanine ligase [Verrucomicrobiota bacterium]